MAGEVDTASPAIDQPLARPPDLGIDSDELTRLALAADPDPRLADDAIPLHEFLETDSSAGALVPSWYMPAPAPTRPLRGWRRRVVLLIIASFVLINAYGLCSTYGYVGFG